MIEEQKYISHIPKEDGRIATVIECGDDIVFFRYEDEPTTKTRMVCKEDFERYFETRIVYENPQS